VKRQSKKPQENNEKLNQALNKWADLVHLQYNAALCIVFGSISGVLFDSGTRPFCWRLAAIALSLNIAGAVMLSGLTSNWRHYSFIDSVRERGLLHEPQQRKGPTPDASRLDITQQQGDGADSPKTS
jgi:hypothetical protein